MKKAYTNNFLQCESKEETNFKVRESSGMDIYSTKGTWICHVLKPQALRRIQKEEWGGSRPTGYTGLLSSCTLVPKRLAQISGEGDGLGHLTLSSIRKERDRITVRSYGGKTSQRFRCISASPAGASEGGNIQVTKVGLLASSFCFQESQKMPIPSMAKKLHPFNFFSSAHKYNSFWVPHEGLSIQVWREFSLDTPKLSFLSRVSWQAKRGYLTGHPEVCKEAGVFINSESSPDKEV